MQHLLRFTGLLLAVHRVTAVQFELFGP
jgi:hypothetical protein